MDILVWVWWLVSTLLWAVFALLWFLISGWVSTLLQIGILIAAVYFLKYGWQRAPAEIWRRSRTFGRFFLNWVRAREPKSASISPSGQGVRVVRVKEFGDINISTLLSLLMLMGFLLVTRL